MTITNVDSVACLNDVAIRYINHLLEKHAMDQYMLQNQKPADERVLARLTEIRAKNTELEFKNRELRSQNEGLNRAIDTLHTHMSQEIRQLRLQIDQLLHEKHDAAPRPMVPENMGQPVYTEPNKYPAPGAAVVNEALHRMTTQGVNPLTHDEQREYDRLRAKIAGK